MKRLIQYPALAMAAILGIAGAAQAANPLENRVPKDAIVYFGWSGSDAQAAAYQGSKLKSFVEASAAPQLIAEQLPKLIEMASRQDPSAPQIIAKLQSGLGIAWHHPTAMYLCPVTFDNPRQPQVRAGLVCDAGTDAPALAALLKEAIAPLPPTSEPQISVTVDGNLVGLIVGKGGATAAEREKDGTLSANPDYAKAMGHFKTANPAFATYININKGMTLARDAIANVPEISADNRTKINNTVELLGLNQLTQLAGVEGFDGKEWSSHSFVGINGAPKGILTLVASTPISDAALAAVPKDAVMFTASKLDLPQAYQEARKIIGAVDPGTLQQMDAALAQVKPQIGLDPEQDILAPLGDEWIIYRAPLSDMGGTNMALVHKLRDGDRFAKTIAAIEEMANKAGGGQFKIDKMTESKIEFSTVTYLTYSLAWTVRNGYFYLSSMDGIAGAVKQVENKLPNITQSDLYQKALASAGATGVKPTSVSYSNPAKTYPELRRNVIGVLPLLRQVGMEIPMTIFPESDVVAPFLTPGADVTWWDAEGFHMAGHSAFPGAGLIGGNGGSPMTMVALGAVGAGVFLGTARSTQVMPVQPPQQPIRNTLP